MNDTKVNSRERQIWFDGRQIALKQQDIWSLVNNSTIDKILVTGSQRKEGNFPLKTRFMVQVDSEEELQDVAADDVVMSENLHLLNLAKKQGLKTCLFFPVEGRHALEESWQTALPYDYLLVDFDLPTNIPLELIIARLQQSSTAVLKCVSTFMDMEIAFGVMERGSDGVLISTSDLQEILKVSDYLDKSNTGNIELHPLVVNKVAHIGMGMRACIDTTGIMGQDEGMIVGSTSMGGVFVCSETHFLPYMNLRPFRVNAGAVHSYVWMPHDTAEYITDISAGGKVLCVNTKGETRTLTVGRVKTEVRPLLLISGMAAGKEINVIVQDDWHIRIMGADGKPRNATMIQPGDELFAYVCEPGRHVGIKINETILEK